MSTATGTPPPPCTEPAGTTAWDAALAPSPRWLPGGHVQTIWSAKLARRAHGVAPTYVRERWATPDGDFVDADWLHAPAAPDDAPVLVLLHGLEGSSASHYAQACAAQALRCGWHYVVPHFRGCSGEPNRLPRAYHSGDHQEIGWMLAQVRQRRAGPVCVAGISLGGNALMRWAQEAGPAARRLACAVAAVSAPLDLVAAGKALGQGWNRWLYTPMFLRTMQDKARHKWRHWPGSFDLDAALRARTLEAFDDAFTAPLHGFAGVHDYWRRASAWPHMHRVELPALLLNARNDPFVPVSSLPPQRWRHLPHLHIWQPPGGGHAGFASGGFPAHVQALPEALWAWFSAALSDAAPSRHGCNR